MYGDRIKNYPKPLADILEIGETSDLYDQACGDQSDAAVLLRVSSYTDPSSYQEAMNSPDFELWEGASRCELK